MKPGLSSPLGFPLAQRSSSRPSLRQGYLIGAASVRERFPPTRSLTLAALFRIAPQIRQSPQGRAVDGKPMGYAVRLDAFHGPLDLLLYLVKKEEVDILEVPIARLADQFLAYLLTLREIDVELAGEFLLLAATLMEIKARSLIPVEHLELGDGEDGDPRANLVKDLLEYRRTKDTAAALDDMAGRNAMHFVRIQPVEPSDPGRVAVKAVELWDLVSAFARLMRETQATQVQTLVQDDTPQHVYETWVKEQVERAGRLNFRDIFTPPYHRSRLVGLFLAVLELIKVHAIGLVQEVLFAEIWLHSFAVDAAQTLPLAA